MSSVTIDNLKNYTFKCISEAWIEFNHYSDYQLDIVYVPTEVDFWKRNCAEVRNELYEANEIIEFGDIPEAHQSIAQDFHFKINNCGKDPLEVVDDFLRENGYQGIERTARAA